MNDFVNKVLSLFKPKKQEFCSPIGKMLPKPPEGMAYGQLTDKPVPNFNEEKNAFMPSGVLPSASQAPKTNLPMTRDEVIMLSDIAKAYGMTPSEMLASYYQESSFGQNPNIKKENYATALGPFQITRNYTERNEYGKPKAYPGYEELFIEPDDRLDLRKSAEFRGKHFKRFNDLFGDRDKAINTYYGDSTYAPKIRAREKEQLILDLLKLLE